MSTINNIGIIYGSSTCFTEMASEAIANELAQQLPGVSTTLHDIADEGITHFDGYDLCLLGIPTWDYGELQEDWDTYWDELIEQDLSGHTFALFGLGDQIGYPQWFQDALGYLNAVIINAGGRVIGHWPIEGYSYETSKAHTADGSHFVGLALDDETQPELSPNRIKCWVTQIIGEF